MKKFVLLVVIWGVIVLVFKTFMACLGFKPTNSCEVE